MSAVKLDRAFELHGQIREKLTALQNLAADLEDPQLSLAVRGAMTANTSGMARLTNLLQATKATDLLDDRHHSEDVEQVSQEA